VKRPLPALAAAAAFALSVGAAAQSQLVQTARPPLVQLSSDPFTNTGGAEHKTELEADTYAWGNTIVGAFQTGRYPDGGSSDIGWATSSDGGTTWSYGFLPGLSQGQNQKNPYQRISDPAVAYDAAHGVWMISSLPVTSGTAPAVVISTSEDGINWNNPVSVASAPTGSDKNWNVCDNWPQSPYFGNCYVEWDDGNNTIHMNLSSDGGATWGPTQSGGRGAVGLGGQPVVQPSGKVIVPFSDGGSNVLTIDSNDGGVTWSNAIKISAESDHAVSGMRAPSLPSAQIDGAGNVFVVWHDCSFRASCASNDIVLSTSADGVTWSPKARIPIDSTSSSVDHFTPGIGVDRNTSGSGAHLGVVYNFFPKAKCAPATCLMHTAFITSANGGATWSKPVVLTGAMQEPWMANAGGYFVGDYVATAFTPDGLAHSVFALAKKPKKGVGGLDEAAYTTAAGLPVDTSGPQFSSRFERPIPGVHSDHPRMHYPPKKSASSKKVFERD
jgi:hypothetical protein